MLDVKALLMKLIKKHRQTFNPTRGSSYAEYGGCFYETCGSIVHIHLGMSGLSADTGATVFTMPSELRPDATVFAQGTSGSVGSQVIAELGIDGNLRVYPSSTYCGVDMYYFLGGVLLNFIIPSLRREVVAVC